MSGYIVTWIGDDSHTGAEGGAARHHGGTLFGSDEQEKAFSYAEDMAKDAGVTYVVSERDGFDGRGQEIKRFGDHAE